MSRADVLATALAALRAERDELDRAIVSLERVIAGGEFAGLPAPVTPPAATKPPRKPGPTGIPRATREPDRGPRKGKLSGRVVEIKKLWDTGLTLEAIAAKVGCSAEAIRLVGKAHRWVRLPTPAVTRLAPGVSHRPEDE